MKRPVVLAVLVLLLAGCTYTGSDNPVVRKFSWFSTVQADDLRPLCVAGAPDRARLIYNGVYQEQVRAYDLVAEGTSEEWAASLTARVTTAGNLREVEASDPLSPWRARIETTRLGAADFERLKAALEESGVTGPAPIGLELDSDGFYWTVAACLDGAWHFTAYRWPSERFEAVTFDDLLFAWDFTGVPVAEPRKTTKLELYGSTSPSKAEDLSFLMRVGEGGLWGAAPLF